MKHISPTKLFNDQLILVGERKAKIILGNFISAEKAFISATRLLNIKKLSMLVKVKNSSYAIKYTYDKTEDKLVATKIIQM